MNFLNKKTSMMTILLLSVGAFSSGAYATPTFCSDDDPETTNFDGVALTDMTFDGSSASDCYGLDGPNEDETNIWGTDTGWTLLAKDNTPDDTDEADNELSGIVDGIEFTLGATPQGGTTSIGDWTLSWRELLVGDSGYDSLANGYNLTMDVIGVLKGSNQFASYLFEDLKFTSNDTGDGTWKINYQNNGSQIPTLSHLSLYYKNAVHTDPEPEEKPDPPENIPEPGILALFGLGMMGIGFATRRQKRS